MQVAFPGAFLLQSTAGTTGPFWVSITRKQEFAMSYLSTQWENRRWLRIPAFLLLGLVAIYLATLSPLHRSGVPQPRSEAFAAIPSVSPSFATRNALRYDNKSPSTAS